jgi:hypothetical protein
LGFTTDEILAKDFERDFLKQAPSEEIALIRYEHHLKKRNSKVY